MDDLDRLEREIGRFETDPEGWCRRAAELGYAATFTPCLDNDEPTLCMGAWQAPAIAYSEDPEIRAIAAVACCDWTRLEAVRLGAVVE